MRILFLASCCDGLGHLNRMACIAEEIRNINPRHKILFLTAPGKDSFLKNEFEYIELPLSGQTQTENGALPDLDVQACCQVVRDYEPDVVVFDTHFPLALLRRVKLKGIKTAVILRKAKKEYFKSIVRLKEVDLFIFPHERKELKNYPIPKKSKAAFVGPVVRKFDESKTRVVVRKYEIKKGDFVVVFTCGSGGHAESSEFVDAAIKSYRLLRKRIKNLKFIILAGPYFKGKTSFEDILVKNFEPESINLMRTADLVVAVASYNTCNEIISAKAPSLLIPAKRKNEDQIERARRMEKMGVAVVLEHANGKNIAGSISKFYASGKRSRMKELFSKICMKTGNRKAAKIILGLKLR